MNKVRGNISCNMATTIWLVIFSVLLPCMNYAGEARGDKTSADSLQKDNARIAHIISDRGHGAGEYKGLKPTPDGMKVAYSGPFICDTAVFAEEQADFQQAMAEAEANGIILKSISGWYVVSFKKEDFPYYLKEVEDSLVRVSVNGKTLDDEAREIVASAGGKLSHTYQILEGFAAKIPADMVEKVRQNPMIDGVYEDAIGHPADGAHARSDAGDGNMPDAFRPVTIELPNAQTDGQ